MFTDTIGATWKGVSALLSHSKKLDTEFVEGALSEVMDFVSKHTGSVKIELDGFKFMEKADDLYKLLMPRLPHDLAIEFRQVGNVNGFELMRQLNRKLDPLEATWHSTCGRK